MIKDSPHALFKSGANDHASSLRCLPWIHRQFFGLAYGALTVWSSAAGQCGQAVMGGSSCEQDEDHAAGIIVKIEP